MGLTGYYRGFIQNYGMIAAPLTVMLKHNSFQWSEEARSTFQQLKQVMASPPVLSLPDLSKTFVIEYDASGRDIGGTHARRQTNLIPKSSS